MRGRHKPGEGFSLIEVLVTIFILGVVAVTLISAFIYGFNLLQKTKKTALATGIAQTEVERFRNMSFDQIAALGTPPVTQTLSTESLAILQDGVNFADGQGTITLEDGGGDDIRKMTVAITWKYRGQTQSKSVVTYIARDGINRR